MIDRIYRTAEASGIPVWCQDEAGPYQTCPHPGASWEPQGHPQRQDHEYLRMGTAKLLTLFRPATGELRASGVTRATNAILHPWVQGELTAILTTMGITQPEPIGTAADQAIWEAWLGHPPGQPLPPLRAILIWDNLAGHHSHSMVRWLYTHGIWPVYTPIGGSWLNMAESIQRIVVRRALTGQHPTSVEQIIDWLDATVRGWNAAPTPFVWGGARQERRSRARQRRLGGSGATIRLAA